MGERPATQPDVNPAVVATDPLLGEISHLLSALGHHVGPDTWAQLETRHQELFADLVDAHAVLDPEDPDTAPQYTPRWWRESWDGPTDTADSRDPDTTSREPDPFGYDEHRPVPAPDYAPPISGAMRLARGATLGERHTSSSAFLLEDQLAVYEWAKRNAKPFRRTVGHPAGEINATMATYPSLNEARTFLAGYRAAREARWASQVPDPR